MRTPCWLPCLAAVITSHAMQRGATSSIGMELTLGEIQAKILPSLSVLLLQWYLLMSLRKRRVICGSTKFLKGSLVEDKLLVFERFTLCDLKIFKLLQTAHYILTGLGESGILWNKLVSSASTQSWFTYLFLCRCFFLFVAYFRRYNVHTEIVFVIGWKLQPLSQHNTVAFS